MAVTATKTQTTRDVLNDANPNLVSDALKKVQLGEVLTVVEKVINQAASPFITLDPPALIVQAADVLAGTAAVGSRFICCSTITPGQIGTTGIFFASQALDGSRITFEANVTQVAVRYIPRAKSNLESKFAE